MLEPAPAATFFHSLPGSPAQVREQFLRDGFLVLPSFCSEQACTLLRQRMTELCEAWDPGTLLSCFSTHEQSRVIDDYFLASGDRIHFFFEPASLTSDGQLRLPKRQALNKVGHALHVLDPVFARFSQAPELSALARLLGLTDPRLLQSMYIFQSAGVGGEVVSHQDATFLYTEPPTCLGLWFALQEATLENGCLWVLPGGHRGPLRRRFVRRTEGGTAFVELDATPIDESQMVPVPVPRGSLVLLHGLLPHRSSANHSAHSREAYTLHFVERAASYPENNWLRPAAEPS